jgi:deoxycytidylate deaminase
MDSDQLNDTSVQGSRPDEEFPDELIFAFVYAIGTHMESIQAQLADDLSRFGYSVEPIKISDLFEDYLVLCEGLTLDEQPYFKRIYSRMEVGNRLRRVSGQEDICARIAIEAINHERPQGVYRARPRKAYVITSLKREEEVALLREVYGAGFFLIGVYAPEQERLLHLQTQEAVSETEARQLIERDKSEVKDLLGQRTGDTYALADVFIPQDPNVYKDRLSRFIDLVFGYPYHTPTQDEHGMFLAYAASLRSGDLSRQVGAALMTLHGDVLAVGCNDVPRFGGGLYWPGVGDQRDHVRGSDSNEKRRDEIIRELLGYLINEAAVSEEYTLAQVVPIFEGHEEIVENIRREPDLCSRISRALRNPAPISLDMAKDLLRDTSLFGLTEFGRTVHAEMDALFTCARTGRSTTGSALYTTTFPCHNCTRHIVTAGVSRVVYIEPYPKSLAFRLHFDSIVLNERGLDRSNVDGCQQKVVFEPFLGVGPRRFFDLFSVKLSTGRTVKRKEYRKDGEIIAWQRLGQRPRVALEATSYLDREENVAVDLFQTLARKNPSIIKS